MDPLPISEVVRECMARASRGEEPEYDRNFRRAYHTCLEDVIRYVRQGATLADLVAHADRVQEWRERGWRDGLGLPAFERGA